MNIFLAIGGPVWVLASLVCILSSFTDSPIMVPGEDPALHRWIVYAPAILAILYGIGRWISTKFEKDDMVD